MKSDDLQEEFAGADGESARQVNGLFESLLAESFG